MYIHTQVINVYNKQSQVDSQSTPLIKTAFKPGNQLPIINPQLLLPNQRWDKPEWQIRYVNDDFNAEQVR